MSRPIVVEFPGGLAVDAVIGGHRIRTDQPESAGGRGAGPSPFGVFLGSLAACAGYFALEFCRQRDLSTEGLEVRLLPEWNHETHRLDDIELEVTLPSGFPEKYRRAIVRAVDQCSVKRVLLDPPDMEVTVIATQMAAPDPAAAVPVGR